jgi:hypothetical protein
MAVALTADTNWGVTVEEVSALTPQVAIGEDPAAVADPVFYEADRRITVPEVQGWIEGVAARVSLRLANMSRLTDAGQIAALGKAAHDAVANGAAWYVVTAAHPIGQINDASGYGEILRARYEAALDTAGTQLDAWVVEIENGDGPGVTITAPSYFFPTTLFPDGGRF